jgi:paraquat-inducible protein B
MLVALPELGHGHKALCPRCGATLTTEWDAPRQRPTAYALAALFMLLLSNLFPFIYMKVGGITSQVDLLEIPGVMFSEDYASLGTFFLLFVQIVPAFCLVVILLLVNRVRMPAPLKIRLARILFQLKSWGMAEIFLAGILVSFVKLMAYGDVGIGSSFIPWCLYCVLQLRAFQCVDRRWAWDDIAPAPTLAQTVKVGVPGIRQGLRSCPCCTAVLPADLDVCPRCETKGHVRRKNSLQWTMALLVTSIMLYLPANILPIMITDLLGDKMPSTILAGVILLWGEGSYPVAGVIFIASIMVPTLKMIAIAWLCWDAKGHGKRDSERMHLIYEVVEFVGRWSMIDVFVIAVLSALVRMGGLMSIYRGIVSLNQAMRKSKSMENKSGEAKVQKVKNWSPVWIFPIVTALIGAWILFYHYSHQGPEVTLITTNAEGIEGGKTTIKSRSVDVGVVESATLTDDLTHVEIKARLNAGMEKLLHGDSVFWVVKPQVGREGISGLGTLLSGAYIELQPGAKGNQPAKYQLLDSPPLAPPDAKGIRVILDSKKAGQLTAGDPVLFRGYRVGSVEKSTFDPQKRAISYQLFINAPNDRLVTSNVRFWKDSGIAVDLTSAGMRVEMGSLTTLFGGGVSFDVPEGLDLGQPVAENTAFRLFDDQKSIQDALYTDHVDFLMFFKDSVRGLQPGAPVEFRGIRLGTVGQVPFFVPGLSQMLDDDYRIPVLIRIEPERLLNQIGENQDIAAHISQLMERGLRGSLKTGNLVTGALYVDMDFYPKAPPITGIREFGGYKIIPTVSSGLAQIQQRLMETLDKINNLPLNPMIEAATNSLSESQATMRRLQTTLDNINKITASQSMQQLPQDMQKTLRELNRSMQGFQPGSAAYNKMVADMQRLDQVLRELQPVLKTLNEKSNALVFEAKDKKDPEPKRAKE